MAIKLDGHTINALNLKASDGSEVTKQLTEEGTIPTPTGTKQITANGTYDVTDKASAVVNVGGDAPTLITKSITENGTYSASADDADGYSSVTVNVSGGGGSTLPPEYQQVEYIETSGTQYLKTGLLENFDGINANGMNFYLDIQALETSSNVAIAIAKSGETGRWFGLGNDGKYGIGGGVNLNNITPTNRNVIKVGFVSNGISITSGEETITRTANRNEYPVCIGNAERSTAAISKIKAKFYSVKAKIVNTADAETVVMDLIPCYRIADNTIGMFDLVSQIFLTNAGTGTFTKGENV